MNLYSLSRQKISLATVRANGGFSTILAILLTGFLVTLAAGILFLFLVENRINQSLFNGAAAYHAAEWAIEYGLLKLKNHREGFADELVIESSEWKRIGLGLGARSAKIGYSTTARASSHTGIIAANDFVIIPLFYDAGSKLSEWNESGSPVTSGGKPFLDPRDRTSNLIKTTGFRVQLDAVAGSTVSDVVWNVIGNRLDGATYGIAGSANASNALWYMVDGVNTIGKFRELNGSVLSEVDKAIGDFLSQYEENYLVLYNPSDIGVKYAITAPNEFSLPSTTIVASGRVRDSLVNLEISRNKSALFEMLKYSLFVR